MRDNLVAYILQHQNVTEQVEKLRAIEGQLPKEGIFYVRVGSPIRVQGDRTPDPVYKVEINGSTVLYSRIEVL